MTSGRVAMWGVIFLIPILLFVWLQGARNDLQYTTRSVIGQMKKADEEGFHRFFIRLRLPDGNPDRQEQEFYTLWEAARSLQIENTEDGKNGTLEADDGRPHPFRQVICHGRDRNGEPMTLRVDWVQERGTWYFHNCALL